MALLVVGSYGAAYWKGRQAGWDAREGAAQAEIREADRLAAVLAGKRRAVTERVVVQYRDRVRVVNQHGEEVIREIERSVPPGAPDLAGYFRRLHDLSCCEGSVSGAAGRVNAEAPVAAADAIRTIAGNYDACHTNAEQLAALQLWIKQQLEVTP